MDFPVSAGSTALANLYVAIQAKGMPQVHAELDKVEKATKRFKGYRGIPAEMGQSIRELAETRRPIAILDRALSKLGGEMTGGMRIAGDMFRRAIAEKMQPSMEKLQKQMMQQVAVTRGWGSTQTWAATQLVKAHTVVGIYTERMKVWDTITGGATRAARNSFLLLTGGIMGFVTAGLQGTVQGEMLGYQMQQLSREIAAIFLPTINMVIDALRETVNWFRGLSKEQQDNIRGWVLWTAGITGATYALLKLGGAAYAAWPAIKGLWTIMIATDPVLAGIMAIVGAVALLVYNIQKATEEMEKFVYMSASQADVDKLPFTKTLQMMKDRGASQEEMNAAVGAERRRLAQTEEEAAKREAALKEQRAFLWTARSGVAQTGQGFGRRGMFDSELDDEIEIARKRKERAYRQRLALQSAAGQVMFGQPGPSGRRGDHMALTQSAGQFESLAGSWNRLASASLKTGAPAVDHAKRAADALESMDQDGVKIKEGGTIGLPAVSGGTG